MTERDILTIDTYPWPTIDARDLLLRVKEAEAEAAHAKQEGTGIYYHVLFAIAEARITGLEADPKKEGSAERALTQLAGHVLTPAEVGLDPDDVLYAWSPSYKAIAERIINLEAKPSVALDGTTASAIDLILLEAGIKPRSDVEALPNALDIVDRVRRLEAARVKAVDNYYATAGYDKTATGSGAEETESGGT